MSQLAFQENYPEEFAHCYGCGTQNERGHRLKSYWDGDTTIAHFTPEPWHTAIPGFVYGGLIASLIDCHGTGSAAAFGYRAEHRELGTEPPLRYVTASLKVDYLAPTPLGGELELRGRLVEAKERKITVEVTVKAEGKVCARGTAIAVKIPETMTCP